VLVDTRVGRLFVETVGEGPEVFLWHSLLCDGGMWKEQTRALRDRFRFVNVDAPGHGRSGPVRRAFTLEDCVDATLQVFDATGLRRPGFCGLSWGGMVGMRLALAHPDRVAALALMDTSARAEIAEKRLRYRVLLGIARVTGPTEALAPAVERLMFSDAFRREHPDVVLEFRGGLLRMDREALTHTVHAVTIDRADITASLPAIATPTLVMCGSADRATPPAQSELIARLVPGARLVAIPGAGHLSALEQPALVNAELASFFGRHLPAPASA
jgi:3-oxoadipate enol-lactonase